MLKKVLTIIFCICLVLVLASCSQQEKPGTFDGNPNHEIVDGKKISNELELFIKPSELKIIDLGYSLTLEACMEEAQSYIKENDLDDQNTEYICGTKCLVKWDDRGPSDCSIQEKCIQDKCERL